MASIRILTADDHPVLRSGLAAIIQTQPDMVLIGEASTGHAAVEHFRKLKPDITRMDLQMAEMNGLDAIQTIRKEYPEARIIVLTTYSGDAGRSMRDDPTANGLVTGVFGRGSSVRTSPCKLQHRSQKY
jgi:DNA-binding NarL/FixJ family response regulator